MSVTGLRVPCPECGNDPERRYRVVSFSWWEPMPDVNPRSKTDREALDRWLSETCAGHRSEPTRMPCLGCGGRGTITRERAVLIAEVQRYYAAIQRRYPRRVPLDVIRERTGLGRGYPRGPLDIEPIAFALSGWGPISVMRRMVRDLRSLQSQTISNRGER